MPEIKNYSQWSADNALDKDPIDALREYTDYARMQYLRSGVPMNTVEPELRAGIEDKLKADGLLNEETTPEQLSELQTRLFAPKTNLDFDAAVVQNYLALDDPDSGDEETKNNSALLRDYLAKKKYSAELAAPLEGAVKDLLQDSALVRRARVAAVDRGEYNAIAVTEDDGTRNVYAGSRDLEDSEIPMVAESLVRSGALDTSDIVGLQDNYRKVFGGKSTLNQNARSAMFNDVLDSLSKTDSEIADILGGASAAAAKQDALSREGFVGKAAAFAKGSLAAPFVGIGAAVGAAMGLEQPKPTGAEIAEYQFRQGDSTAAEMIRQKLLENPAMRKRFSEQEITAFTNDRVLKQTDYKFDNTKPESGLRQLSTGEVNIAPALLVSPQKLEDALGKAPLNEDQKEFARRQRAALLDVRVPQMLKLISSSSDEAVSAYATAKQNGVGDREFVEQWLSNEDNYGMFSNTASSLAYSGIQALGSVPIGIASLLGSETATTIMLRSQAKQARYAEYGALFGDEFGLTREALTALPAVAVDIALTIGTAGVGRAASAAARAGSMSARTLAKGAVGVLDDAALAAVRGASAGAAAETSAALQAAGRSWISKAATTAVEQTIPVALPAFTRSASSTYVSIYGSLPEDMTHEEKHKQAIGFALAAGVGTAAITAGLSALGAGGVEKLGVRIAAKGLDDLTYREAKVLFETVKNEGKAVSDVAFQKALAAEVGGNYKRLIGSTAAGFRDEAFEEALDQSINMAIEDAALKKNRPLAEKLQQVWNAGLIGGVLGGGINVASQAFTPTASAQTKALQQRTAVLDGIAKRLSTSNAPETAASVQRMMDDANAAAAASVKKDTAAAATQAAKAPTTAVRTVAEQLEFKFDDPRGVPPADTRLADLIGERVYIGDTGINGIAEIDANTGEVVINFSKPTKVKDKPNVTRYVLGTKFQKATGVTLKPKIKTLAKPVGALPVGTRIFNINKMEFVLPTVEAVDKARAAGKPLLVLQRDENQRVVGVMVRGASLVASPTTTTDTTITDPDLMREVLRLYPEPAPAPAPETGEQLELGFGPAAAAAAKPAAKKAAKKEAAASPRQSLRTQVASKVLKTGDILIDRNTGERVTVESVDANFGKFAVIRNGKREVALNMAHPFEWPDLAAPEPTPAPEPEPTTPRGENRVPKLQEFMDRDPELAALVEETLAAGTDILFATSRAQAVTELGPPELPPNRKSSRTLATVFVRTDGSTGIVLYSGAMQKGKDLKKIIAHERIHVEQYRFEDTPEGAAAATAAEATFDTESLEYDKKLDSFMRKEYPSWDKLSLRGKLRGANLAMVEGLLTGETSHFKPGFFSYLQGFLRHTQQVFAGDNAMASYTRAVAEQVSKAAPKAPAKKVATPAPTPTAPEPTPEPEPEPELQALLEDTDQLEIDFDAEAPETTKANLNALSVILAGDPVLNFLRAADPKRKGFAASVQQISDGEWSEAGAALEEAYDFVADLGDSEPLLTKAALDTLGPILFKYDTGTTIRKRAAKQAQPKPARRNQGARPTSPAPKAEAPPVAPAPEPTPAPEPEPKPAAKKAARKAAPAPTPSPAAKKAARKETKPEQAKEQVLNEVAQALVKLEQALVKERKLGSRQLGDRKIAREISEKLTGLGFAPADTPEGFFLNVVDAGDPSAFERLVGAFQWASGQPEPVAEATPEPAAELEPDDLQERVEALIADEARRGVLIGKVVQLRLYPENSTRTDTVPLEIVGFDEGDILAVDPGTNKSRATTYPLDEFVLESFTKYLEAGNTEPETYAPLVQGEPLPAVHYSRTPLKLRKRVDIKGIPDSYLEESTFGQGFYAMEPQDEAMWTGMTNFTLGQNRNVVSITPRNPFLFTPETLRTLGFDEAKSQWESGRYDALVVRGFEEADDGRIDGLVRQYWKPVFPEGKTSGTFLNGDEYDAAYARATEEVTGIPAAEWLKASDAAWNQNQIFIPADNAPDIVAVEAGNTEPEAGAAAAKVIAEKNKPVSPNDKRITAPDAESNGMVVFERPDGSRYQLLDNSKTPEEYQNLNGQSVLIPGYDESNRRGGFSLTAKPQRRDFYNFDLETPTGDTVYDALDYSGRPLTVNATELFNLGATIATKPAEPEAGAPAAAAEPEAPAPEPSTPPADPQAGTLSMLAPQGTRPPVMSIFAPEALSGANTGYKSRSVVVEMRIDDFLKYALPLPSESRRDARDSFDRGVKWESLPALMVDDSNRSEVRISGHEGRHRALVLKEAGYDTMPVEIRSTSIRWSEQDDPSRFDYKETLPTEILSEDGTQTLPYPATRKSYVEEKGVIERLTKSTGSLSMLAPQGDNELRQNIADIPAALQGMLPAGFTLVADPNMDGALGYNAVTAPTTVFYNPNLVGSLTVGLARADALATLRTAVDHELGHAAAEEAFGEESYAALATELGEDMLSNIASIYYSLVEPDFNLRAERIKADRESGALPDWKIAAEWVRMEIERIANGRTSEQRMLFLRSRPSLLAKFIDALDAFIVRLRARFFENPTTGTAASISNAARQLRKLKNGGYLPAAPKADPNLLGHAAEFMGALERGSDQTLFTMPIGAATAAGKAQVDGLWKRIRKKFQNLPPEFRPLMEEQSGIFTDATDKSAAYQKSYERLLKKYPSASLDDIGLVLGRTDPTLDDAALARIQTELDAFAATLPADMDYDDAEELITKKRDEVSQRERIASNTAFGAEQAAAEQRLRNDGHGEITDLVKRFRGYIDRMTEKYPELSVVIAENEGVYLMRTYRFFHTEGWALLAGGNLQPDGTQLGMFRDKEIDFGKLRANAAKTYEQDVIAEAAKEGVVLTAEQLRDKVFTKLDAYLEYMQKGVESEPSPSGGTLKKDMNRLLPKGNINKAILDLLGVVEDPLENAIRTMNAVGKLAAKQTFMRGAREMMLNSGLASTKQTQTNSVLALGKVGDPSVSPLGELWTTPELAQALQAEFGVNGRGAEKSTDSLMREVGRVMTKAASVATTMKTLGSIGFYPRNIVSGQVLLLGAQGILPVNSNTTKAWGLATRAYFESWSRTDEQAAAISRMIELQVLKDDTQGRVAVDMMRGLVTNSEQDLDALLDEFQEAASGNPKKLMGRLKQGAGKGYGTTVEFLAALNNIADGAVKAQAYMFELDVLKKDAAARLEQAAQNPNPKVLAALNAELEARAADKVKDTFPSHSRQYNWVKSLNQTSVGMVFFPFARWKTEVFRTMYNTPRLAIKEIREGGPAERVRGFRRMFGFLSTMAIGGKTLGLVYSAIFSALGDDEDKDGQQDRKLTDGELYALREALPDWQRSHAIYTRLIGGEVQVIDLTAMTPYAQLTDIFGIAIEGLKSGEGVNSKRIASYVATQLIGTQIAASAASEVINNRDDFGQTIYNETDNLAEVFYKSFAHYGKGALKPGAYDFYQRATRSGEQNKFEIVLGELLGARPRSHKLSEIEYRALRGVKRMLDDSAQIKSSLVTGRKLDEEEVVDTLLEHQDALNRTQRKLSKTIQGLKSMGSTRGTLFGSAKTAGFSAQRMEFAEQGKNLRWVGNQEWLKGVYQNMTRTGEDDPMNRINLLRRTLLGMPATYDVLE